MIYLLTAYNKSFIIREKYIPWWSIRTEIRGPSNQLQGVLDGTITMHKIESSRSEVVLCWEIPMLLAQLLNRNLLEFNYLVKIALIFPFFSRVYFHVSCRH